MTQRVKNTATVADVAKVILGCLKTSLGDAHSISCDQDLQDVGDKYCEVILDILKLTPRPNQSLLQQSAAEAFKTEKAQAEGWSKSIHQVIKHCRETSRSVSSGVKLSKGVQTIALHMKKLKEENRLPSRSPEQTDSQLSYQKGCL